MRRLRSRSGRREAGAFLVEGPQAVREAVRCSDVVRTVFATGAAAERFDDVIAHAQAAGAVIVPVTAEVLEAIAETDAPQGIVAECALLDWPLDAALGRDRISIALESISDPGNAGTVIRTADAVGAAGVVLTPGSVDPHNGKCVRATAGSLFHLPVATDASIPQVRAATDELGLLLVGVSGDGEVDVFDWLATAPVGRCWLLGSEAHGLSAEARSTVDVTVRIPMVGRAESLNVAMAAGICLYADRISRHGRMGSS